MKMVKSLLLGTAAGVVAIAGAQAADLPVKAKPVQYVKICSLYGVGFYYIPGTDTCIKIGGFVRTEFNLNSSGSFGTQQRDLQTRNTVWNNNRTRFLVSVDARSQTAYGTLRAYGRAAWQWDTNSYQVGGSQGSNQVTTATSSQTGQYFSGSSSTYFDRAFIQLGGWTFGKTQSFFDFFPTGVYSLQTNTLYVDTGGSGTPVIAYTYAFGNGLTATLSLEDASEQKLPLVAVGAFTGATSIAGGALATVTNSNLSFTAGGTSVNSTAGNLWPDLVGNIRLDQAWGSAQAMFALTNKRANYWYTLGGGNTSSAASNQNNMIGHPGDKLGWALGAGVTVNLPMIAPGDTISAMITYCEGAARYCSNPAGGVLGSGALYGIRKGRTIGVGFLEDGYYEATSGNLQLSQTWSAAVGFNHKWNPQWQTSLYGMYLDFSANSAVVNGGTNGVGCTSTLTSAQGPIRGTGASGCRDFSAFMIGSRTLWNPVANLDIGVDVIYQKVNSAYSGYGYASSTAGVSGTTGTCALNGAATTTLCVGDASVWQGVVRFQRNFWP